MISETCDRYFSSYRPTLDISIGTSIPVFCQQWKIVLGVPGFHSWIRLAMLESSAMIGLSRYTFHARILYSFRSRDSFMAVVGSTVKATRNCGGTRPLRYLYSV